MMSAAFTPFESSTMRVAFVGFGEIAAAFAKAFVAAGARVSAYDVLLETPDGPARLAARAGGTPVAFAARPPSMDPVIRFFDERLGKEPERK